MVGDERDSLSEARVGALLTGRFGRPYRYVASCASTQLLIDDPLLPEGALAVAERQTAGRGRLGRSWDAPSGRALLLSLRLLPPRGRRIAELSIAAGVAVARAVESTAGVRPGIRWPNDVLVGTRKLAGILCELRGEAVALGIGVNVNQAPDELPAASRTPPTSLLVETGCQHPRAPLLLKLLLELEVAYDAWRVDGLRPLLPDLDARDVLRGERLEVGSLVGIAEGVDSLGRLVVRVGDDLRTAESGEVTVLART